MDFIRLGVCAPIDSILTAEQLGYHYIEGNLSETALLSEPSFKTRLALVRESGIKVEVFGCMLPREMPVTGRGVNAAEMHDYLDFAFRRAKMLGAEICVFASAGARQVPEGWPFDMAWRQLSNFLRLVERHATDHDLIVAIEPLSRGECNLLSTVSEATLLCSILNLRHIRVLADSYHMAMEHEPLLSLTQAGALLSHVHTANALGRGFPKPGDGEDYESLFKTLYAMGYQGRVSIEGCFDDFEAEAREAIQVLDRARSGYPA